MLLGRREECARVERLLADAAGGRSGALAIRGEPGVGKTALVEHAVARAGDLRVLRATGMEAESELPHAGLHQLLRSEFALLDRLPAPYARALRCAFGLADGRVEDRFLVSLGVLALLAEAAGHTGLLCVIDDAHWLDRASSDALLFAARRVDAEGIVLLLAARDEAHSLETSGLPELTLRGLDDEWAAALLDTSADLALDPLVRERLLAASGGYPLAILALTRALTEDQLAGREPLPDPLPVGPRVKSAFLSAIRRLGPDAQSLAVLVALDDLGDLGPITEAARALGVDLAALDELEAGELIVVDGGTVAFRHPLMRSAVQGGATTSERSRAHRALAAALDGEVHEARRAWHRAAAAPGPDAAVADELARAGDEARRRGALAVAATAFERASLLSVATETRAQRLVLAADATWEAGAVSRVGPLLDRAVALSLDDDDRSTAEFLRAALALERGHAAEAFDLFVAAASRVAGTDPARALRALGGAAEASWWLGRRGLLAEVRRVYEQLAVEPGTVGHFFVDVLAGTERLLAFDFPGGVAALRRALGLAAELPAGNELMAAYAAIHLGDPVEAHAQYARVVARLRAAGNLRELPFALTLQAAMECWLGALPAAASHGAESLRLARETGQARSAGYAHAILAHVVALQGDESACHAHVRAADDSVLSGLALQAGTVRWALGRLELGMGRPEAALTHLEAIHDAGDAPLNALFSTPDLIEAAVSAGKLDERCLDAFEHFAAWGRAAGERWQRGVTERMRGLLARDASSADACFARSREELGAAFPYDQARTRLAWGETRRRFRRRIDSREHLRAALALFETIGARPWADRARDELRATGEIAAQSPRPGLDALTPQERQIAELVSGGATNRDIGEELFLSVRTVEYHLHKVFRKLGLASRHALARLVLEDAEERRSSMHHGVPSRIGGVHSLGAGRD